MAGSLMNLNTDPAKQVTLECKRFMSATCCVKQLLSVLSCCRIPSVRDQAVAESLRMSVQLFCPLFVIPWFIISNYIMWAWWHNDKTL